MTDETVTALREAARDVLNNRTCGCYSSDGEGPCTRCGVAYDNLLALLSSPPPKTKHRWIEEPAGGPVTCVQCGAGHTEENDSADCVSSPSPSPEPHVVCGQTFADPVVEARVRLMREQSPQAGPDDGTACGKPIPLEWAFRCVECGRWFHRDCIEQHFAAHRSPPPSPEPPIDEISRGRDGQWRMVDTHGATWLLTPTGDPYMPLRVSMEAHPALGADHAE